MTRLPLAVLAALPFAVLAAPAMAQEPGERVNQLIVYGDDPCPVSAEAEITVCARKDEAERFRIPEPLRSVESPQNDAWNNKVLAYETVGAAGTLSCSPAGPGGSLGCTQKLIDAAYAERRDSSDVRFSQLIDAERQRRLATIDVEASETQARVETLERQYEERRRREEAGEPPAAPPQAQ